MRGAALPGTPLSSPEYVKTVRPAVRLGRRRVPARERRVVERQHVVLRRLGVEEVLHLLDLLRHLGGKVVELGGVLLDVIELPVVPGDHIRRRAVLSSHGRVAGVVAATHPS